MPKEKDRGYAIRYAMVQEDGEIVWADAIGSGCYHRWNDRPPIHVEAWLGPRDDRGDWVSVHVSDMDVAMQVFRFLWGRYTSASLRESESDVDIIAQDLPDEFRPAPVALCCAPVQTIGIGAEILYRRDLSIALAAKRLLPKPVRSRNTTGPLNPRTRSRILERDGFRCKRCGAGPEKAALEVDHIIPRAKGGTNDETNLQTLCWSCNRGKGASDPHPTELSA